MNITNGNLSFKSVVIKDGGLNYVRNNDGNEAFQMLTDAESKYKKSNWRLIVDQNGYSLFSPTTCNTYTGPFSIKRHRKVDKENNVKEQLIIRTGENNKTKFVIDYPTREAVLSIYKKIKNSTGLSKMLMLFEALEQQHLLQKANKKLRESLRRIA